MDKTYESFLKPSNAYRGKPFWAWNGELEKEELLRQIHTMKEMGFGGFFMHSRTGLKTQYLGEKWFQLVRDCTEEAAKLGLEPWIYDEDRWPSGSAGGIVTKNPKYRRKYLTLYMGKTPQINDGTVAVFRGKVDGVTLRDGCTRIPLDQVDRVSLNEEEVYLSFCVREMRKQSVFNGYTDLDRLSLEATQEFIRVTHEQYKEKCGASFDKLYGVFTDEPTHGPIFSDFGDAGEEQRWSLPWTDGLAEVFQDTFGVDLISRLPELYLRLNGKPVSKIKWQYMELVQRLFVDRFLKPIQQWADENNMVITGHFVNEDSLMSQTIPTGSMLRSYGYLGQPGIDCLTDCRYIPWAVKVLESAARQNGQKWKLSELYGATGWHMGFQDYKYVGDWQAVLGINVRCQHLSWYTMEGEAKRDYPGTFLHQATWYREHERLETYFARLGFVISQGEPECHTLVLHPVESLWCQIYPEWSNVLDAADAQIQKLESQFEKLFAWLSETHVDFDYGDEGVLAEKAAVVNKDGRPCLQVGQMTYDRIVVSGCLNIRESTFALLQQFRDCGGELVFFGSAPGHIACQRDDRCRNLAKQARYLPFRRKAVLAYFRGEDTVVHILEPKAGKDLYLQLKKTEDGYFAVLLNTSRDRAHQQMPIRIGDGYAVEIWDCFSGTRQRLPLTDGCAQLDFAPGQEYVLHLLPASECADFVPDRHHYRQEKALTKVSAYKLDEYNIFVLDKAELWANDQMIVAGEETLELDRKLRTYLGLEHRGGEMLQPWAVQDADRVLASIRLTYSFSIEELPQQPMYLVFELMNNMRVKINGRENVLKKTQIRWIDQCFAVYEIVPNALCVGENRLEITADYTQTSGLENLYLLGEFGVYFREENRLSIGALPKNVRIGSLVEQGFPFYSGKITYYFTLPEKTVGSEISLRLPEVGGSCAIAEYASDAQMIPWPWRTARWQSEEQQDLAVQVILHRRNTFGPLHQFPLEQPYTAPDSFVCDDVNRYALHPTGLLRAPRICVTAKENQ